MKNFVGELKRRNVHKVATAYTVGSWLVIQAASILCPAFDAPAWVMKAVIGASVLGFPLALILAWAFEITPEGIQRSGTADAAEPQHNRSKGKRLALFTITAGVAAALLLFFASAHWRKRRSYRSAGTAPLQTWSCNAVF